MVRKRDLWAAPAGEGFLILVMAALGWALRAPLIFASLGPTAFEQVEQPNSPSARPYNIVVGHAIGMGSGFVALWMLHAYASPKVMSAGYVPAARLGAVVVAALLTTLTTLLARATQPASLATALLVALGAMQTARDAVMIAAGVIVIAVVGEPIRRRRARHRPESEPL